MGGQYRRCTERHYCPDDITVSAYTRDGTLRLLLLLGEGKVVVALIHLHYLPSK